MRDLVKRSLGTRRAEEKPSSRVVRQEEQRNTMKKELAAVLAMGLVLASVRAVAEGTNGPSGGGTQGAKSQQRAQDRLQTSSPDVDQKRTRLRESLPETVQ